MESWEKDRFYNLISKGVDALERIASELKELRVALATPGESAPGVPSSLAVDREDPFEVEVYFVSEPQLKVMGDKEREETYPGRGEGWYYRPWSRYPQGHKRPMKIRMAPQGPYASEREARENGELHVQRLEEDFVRKMRGGAGHAG